MVRLIIRIGVVAVVVAIVLAFLWIDYIIHPSQEPVHQNGHGTHTDGELKLISK